MLAKQNYVGKSLYKLLTVQFEKNSELTLLMKKSTNISNKVNLIFTTYKCIFFKLLLRIFDVFEQLRPCKMSQQDSVEMERIWNLHCSKYIKI